MNAIVSVTTNWGIGYQGELLVRNAEDMRYFVRMTRGGIVICGRATYQSFPHGALPNRRNIVLSRDVGFAPEDAEVVRSIEELQVLLGSKSDGDHVWLIGGAHVYNQLLDQCERALVTKHDVCVPADAFFPNLDEKDDWELVSSTPWERTPEGIPYSFCEYHHIASA